MDEKVFKVITRNGKTKEETEYKPVEIEGYTTSDFVKKIVDMFGNGEEVPAITIKDYKTDKHLITLYYDKKFSRYYVAGTNRLF